mgnify:CR=1 FL=1
MKPRLYQNLDQRPPPHRSWSYSCPDSSHKPLNTLHHAQSNDNSSYHNVSPSQILRADRIPTGKALRHRSRIILKSQNL